MSKNEAGPGRMDFPFPVLTRQRRIAFVFLTMLVMLLAAGFRIHQWLNDPEIFFLVDTNDAQWIKHPVPFLLVSDEHFEPIKTLFGCAFELPGRVENVHLVVHAFRQCRVWIDSVPITSEPVFSSSENLSLWKKRHDIRLPSPINPGQHRLWIEVTNSGAPPCLFAYSHELGITTGQGWESTFDGRHWNRVALAVDQSKDISREAEQLGYPSCFHAIYLLWPYIVVVFGIVFVYSFANFGPHQEGARFSAWRLSPMRLLWLLMLGSISMGLNNILRLPVDWGFDADAHIEYVKIIVKEGRLPLATDGWQTFQSPLLYVLATPWYVMFSSLYGPESCVKLLRFLPLLCGIAQIQILFRIARTVFPDRDDLQMITMTVGGLMPMNIYMSQSFANEPLAGCLTSLSIMLCFCLLIDLNRQRKTIYFWFLGFVWGLAMLAKVTPILLAPLIFLVVVFQSWKGEGSFRSGLLRSTITLSACFLTSGWYYVRNWITLGRPFVGGWDPAIGIAWWQDPSYRTWNQLSTFGLSLNQPVYSGVMSFWDAIYSSMWADGFLSGNVPRPINEIPWNLDWMAVSVWLSILPLICMLTGAVRFWNGESVPVRGTLLFSVVAIGIYIAAVTDLYVHVPIYSGAKASYMLGLLPCFSILVAAGAAPLTRFRLTRALFFATFACWAVATYATYFSFLNLAA